MDTTTLVQPYCELLYSAEWGEARAGYLSDEYGEHQYNAGCTTAGLRTYVEGRLDANPNHRMIVHHVLRDGDLVFLFVEERLEDGIDVARAELFRIDGSRIAEHWGAHVIDEKNRKNDN